MLWLIDTTVTMHRVHMNKSTNSAWHILLFASSFALILFLASSGPKALTQNTSETVLSTENACNPIPSPDGKLIAFVRTGYGRPGGSGGFGRSNLVSEVLVMTASGTGVSEKPLADAFLAGWTPDSKKLVCYRDRSYFLVSLSGERSSEGEIPYQEPGNQNERVAYIPSVEAIGWSRVDPSFHTIIESRGHAIANHDSRLGEFLAPSPDGRYLAIFDSNTPKDLWVYDTKLMKWFDLGPLTIEGDDYEWSYLQPNWSPWFADSSHLAFFSHSNLVVSTPDGSEKISILTDARAGLGTPAPDGNLVAYVTFEPTPMKIRPNLQFWGGTTIWVVSTNPGSSPHPVTEKNPARTYDMKWLGLNTLIFDRVDDVSFYRHSRVWRVSVKR